MSGSAVELGHLPTVDDRVEGAITVVIEPSKGMRDKLAYDVESGSFRLKHILPAGSSFPYDFGFVPGTRVADGDPSDVLVSLDEPMPTGTVVPVRLIGVIEAMQQEGGDVIENHRPWLCPARLRARRTSGRSTTCGRASSTSSRPSSPNTNDSGRSTFA